MYVLHTHTAMLNLILGSGASPLVLAKRYEGLHVDLAWGWLCFDPICAWFLGAAGRCTLTSISTIGLLL